MSHLDSPFTPIELTFVNSVCTLVDKVVEKPTSRLSNLFKQATEGDPATTAPEATASAPLYSSIRAFLAARKNYNEEQEREAMFKLLENLGWEKPVFPPLSTAELKKELAAILFDKAAANLLSDQEGRQSLTALAPVFPIKNSPFIARAIKWSVPVARLFNHPVWRITFSAIGTAAVPIASFFIAHKVHQVAISLLCAYVVPVALPYLPLKAAIILAGLYQHRWKVALLSFGASLFLREGSAAHRVAKVSFIFFGSPYSIMMQMCSFHQKLLVKVAQPACRIADWDLALKRGNCSDGEALAQKIEVLRANWIELFSTKNEA